MTTTKSDIMTFPNVASWTFGEAREVTGGLRSFPLANGGISIQLLDCLAPFDTSSLREGSRRSLTLRLPHVWDAAFGDMEAALVTHVAHDSTTFFQTHMSEGGVTDGYKAISIKKDEYPRNVRTKINASGPYAVRYWDMNRAVAEPPHDHAGTRFNAVLRIRALWTGTDNAWGLVVDATDLQILECPSMECPFTADSGLAAEA